MIGILTNQRKLHEAKGKCLSTGVAYEQKMKWQCGKEENKALAGFFYNSCSRPIFNKEGPIDEGPLGFLKFYRY